MLLEATPIEATPIEATPIEATPIEAGPAEAVRLLAVVADQVRWRLLAHLATAGPTCVCALQPVAAVAPNLLSYHLKVLREAGLVTTSRRGRWVDYTVAADAFTRLHAALPGPRTATGCAGPCAGAR